MLSIMATLSLGVRMLVKSVLQEMVLGFWPMLRLLRRKGSDQDRWVGLSRSDKMAQMAKLVRQADCPESQTST